MDMCSIALITRCKDEFFIKEFCDYYLSQGIEKIYIIDDDSNNKNIYSRVANKKINIIFGKDITKKGAAERQL